MIQTHTKDIHGDYLRLGDIVKYNDPESDAIFEVVFEKNAFRKSYPDWDSQDDKPILDTDLHEYIIVGHVHGGRTSDNQKGIVTGYE